MPCQLPSTKYIEPPEVQEPSIRLEKNKNYNNNNEKENCPQYLLHLEPEPPCQVTYKIYNDTITSTLFLTLP